MDQYTVRNGEGNITRIVVWGERDELPARRRLCDALMAEPHIVTECSIDQEAQGCLPFVGTIYFRPKAREHRQVQQLRIVTTDSRVLSGVYELFAAIQSGCFGMIGAHSQADASDFVNFHILFHKAGATVSS